MRTDFREERKWKLALAYMLSTSAKEWHLAGNSSERIRRGICVQWKRPCIRDPEAEDVRREEILPLAPMDIDGPTDSKSNLMSLVEYGSDDEDQDQDQQSVFNVLEPNRLLQDALNDVAAARKSSAELAQDAGELDNK